MKKFINTLLFWFNASRGFTLPTSVISWAVPFVFGITEKGNILNGILALLGIAAVHLGTNLLDDVIDYKIEEKRIKRGLPANLNTNVGKCQFFVREETTPKKAFLVTGLLFSFASIIGLYLTYTCGWQVLTIAGITAILCLAYPLLTYIALGEIIVGIIYSPLLYLGTYFVMTKSYSPELLFISISTGLLTVGLLHIHMLVDYDFDKINNKKTLCSLAGSKKNAVLVELVIIFFAYLNILVGIYFNLLPQAMYLVFLSFPTSVELCKLLKLHIIDSSKILPRTFFMGPMENWENIIKNNTESFMMKFLTARNLMTSFTVLICIAKVITEIKK